MRYRLAFTSCMSLLLALLFILPGGLVLADTPTPTPTRTPAATPSPLPPGFNANANFAVDQDAALPWPLPLPPTFPVASVTPTLYNATAMHGTSYAPAAGTATYQVGQFNAPVNSISTLVAQLAGYASTPNAGDLDTGVSFAGGGISFVDFAEDFADNVGGVVGTALAFLEGLVDLGTYTPWLGALVLGLIAGAVIGAFVDLIILIIKGGIWLVNFFIRLFTLIGSWVPG